MNNLEKIAILAGIAVVVKFLLDGVTFFFHGQPISLGHADSMSYAAVLGPALGAHSYVNGYLNQNNGGSGVESAQRPDDPDGR